MIRPAFTFFRNFALLSLSLALPQVLAADEGIELFEKRIRPVLVERCYECHSATTAKGGLLLDSAGGLLQGGDSGPAIVPGKPDQSLLIKAVSYSDANLQMPPKHRLDAAAVAFLKDWIAIGAPDPRTNIVLSAKARADHWAFQRWADSRPPSTRNPRWAANDIDRFILSKLEERGLQPSPAADRRTLIRRATFDLLGLPPMPEEIEAFLNDRAPGAFERVIDRLLSSRHYGERWGRHWLDVVRYADTAGDSADYPVPQAFRYRNYVIDSFNSDKPYDRFLREQIAGDLLPAASPAQKREQTIATGFIAIARRFSVEPTETMHLTIEDTLDTLGRSVLGLSLSCARCHDHKYDPISTRDYYALYGIFSSTRYPYPGSEVKKQQADFVPLDGAPGLNKNNQAEVNWLETEMQRLEKQLAFLEREGLNVREVRRELKRARQRHGDILAQSALERTAYAVADGTPHNAKIHVRGEPGRLGDEVPRGFLSVLDGYPLAKKQKGSGRLPLAEWLTGSAKHLTARVMVNRIWQHHFGRGLVGTPSDFGTRGQAPTHPELLDYLAERFIASGWSVKAMHKFIMTSQTYRQASADDSVKLASDPANQWLWKFPRQRLDAESIRDAFLQVSGLLERDAGGAHPFPLPSRWEYTQHYQFTANYETPLRSVYLMQQRIRKHPFMATFDGADPNTSTAERPATTTPLQALFALNDKFVFDQADYFAERLLRQCGDSASRVEHAYELSYGRKPARDELRAALSYVDELRTKLEAAQTPDAAKRAWASLARTIMASNEFLFVE